MKLAKRWRKIRRRLKRYQVLNRVVSMGGVGSSSLVRHLEDGDRDRIWYHSRDKHCIHPDLLPEARRYIRSRVGGTDRERAQDPACAHDQERALGPAGRSHARACFLFGDPYAAVFSVFRRGLHRRHEQAMSRTKPGYQVVLEHDTTLEEYLAGGVDRFFLEEHLDNWIGYDGSRIQVMAVKYEALAQHIDEVLGFLRCHRLFPVRSRTGNPGEASPAVRRGLESLYGELKERIDALPSLIRIRTL